MKAATIEPLRHGLMADFRFEAFPTLIYGFKSGEALKIGAAGTAFGFVESGVILAVEGRGRTAEIRAGHCFAIPIAALLTIWPMRENTRGFAAVRLGYEGIGCVAGPVEERGRLRYIDGCSDTLLIAPPLKGDPCFNLLHFPPGIDQTAHTHPSPMTRSRP